MATPIRSVTLRILGDGKQARAVIDWTNAEADKIDARNPTLHIGADSRDAQTALGAFQIELAALTDRLYTFKFDVNDSLMNAKLAGMAVKLAALQKISDRVDAGGTISDAKLGAASAEVLGLAAAYDVLAKKQDAALLAQLPDHATGSAGGGALGALSGQVALFGGLSHVSGWHILADSLIEIGAVAVPATVAILAFGAALVATGPDLDTIYQRETNMYTATDILGQRMPGLTGSLNALSAALKPGVFEVWGDALSIINDNSGEFGKLAEQAVDWVDKLAASITVDLSGGAGVFRELVDTGVTDLKLLGVIAGNVGSILGKLFAVAEQTHIAEDILKVVGAFTSLAAAIVRIVPTPILATVVALHGIYLWGGLATTGLLKMVGGISRLISIIPGLSGIGVLKDIPGTLDKIAASALGSKSGLSYTVSGLRGVAMGADGAAVESGLFKTSLALLSAVPIWGWVAAGVVAVGGLVFWLTRGQNATKQWIDSLNQGIASANNSTVFNLMASDVGKLNFAMGQSAAFIKSVAAQYTTAQQAGGKFGATAADAAFGAAQKNEALAGELTNVTKKMTGFAAGVGWIMTTFKVGYPQAIAIASAAGVNLSNGIIGMSKSAQDARQQITGLLAGFVQLQTPAGVAGTDFEALAFASNNITTKIQSLNSAWSTWLGTVTGGETAFDTFAQGIASLKTDSAGGKVGIDSLSAAGLTLNSAFMTQAGDLSTLEGAMRSADASQKDQTITVKAGIAAMIPFAGSSKEATSVLFALAQQADYTGGDSIKSLASWAGVSAPNALKLMKGAADNATTAASNLAGAISNLLNVQFQNDVINASGASKALAKYTTDLVNNTSTTKQGKADRAQLIADLVKGGMSAQAAAAQVDGYTSAIHRIPAKAPVAIFMTGTGKYTITGISALTSGTTPGTGAGGILPTPTGHAAGFRVPGYGGGDRHPAYLEGGEAVVPKHLVAHIAPFLSAHNVPGFTSGGYQGNVPGLSAFTTGMYNTFGQDMVNSMVAGMKNGIQSLANLLSSSYTGGGSAAKWISAALSITHEPASWLSPLEILVSKESGGRSNAVDQISTAGEHATGLFQTIPSTFAEYAMPGLGNILNPIDDAVAGIRYIAATYGSPYNIPGLLSGHYVGYANGGIISEPMLAMGASGHGIMLGESGPELVTPLSGTTMRAHTGAGDGIYITVNAGDAIDPNAVAQAIWLSLRRFKKKKGNVPLGLG